VEYKIEKGIPIPKIKRLNPNCRVVPLYIWIEMEIGDSFFIPNRDGSSMGYVLKHINKRYAPKRFIVRTLEGGSRIWRKR